jgi:hypothetical protein
MIKFYKNEKYLLTAVDKAGILMKEKMRKEDHTMRIRMMKHVPDGGFVIQ